MLAPLRVLLLEDDPLEAELVVRQLARDGFEPDWTRVEDEAGFASRLHPSLDVILADNHPPSCDPLRALDLMRARQIDVPLIVITGAAGEDAAVECLRRGAADYLLKDRIARLGDAVRHAINDRGLRAAREAASLALTESEERFRGLFEQSRDGILVWHPGGRIILYSPAMERLTGFTQAEMQERGWLNTILQHASDVTKARQTIEGAVAGRLGYLETEIACKDGDRRWISCSFAPILMRDQHHVMSIAADVTVRKRDELERERLLRRERSLAHVIQALMNASGLDRIVSTAVDQSLLATDMDAAGLWLAEPQSRSLRLVVHRGLPSSLVASSSVFGYDSPHATALAARHERLEVVEDVWATDIPSAERRAALHQGIRCIVAVPLRYRDQLIGVVTYIIGRPRTISPQDREYFEIIGGIIAVAIAHSQLNDQLRARELRIDALLSTGAGVDESRRHESRLAATAREEAHLGRLRAILEDFATADQPGLLGAAWASDAIAELDQVVSALRGSSPSPTGEASTRNPETNVGPRGGSAPDSSADWFRGDAVTVFLVAPDDLAREGTRAILEYDASIRVVGETAESALAPRLASEMRPAVVLVSADALDSVSDLIGRLVAQRPAPSVLVMSDDISASRNLDLISAGAVGCLSPHAPAELVIAAVHAAAAGGSVLESSALRVLLQAATKPTAEPTIQLPATASLLSQRETASLLSQREREVLTLICEGLTNRGIGDRLGLAETSVKKYVQAVIRKLGVADRTQAAIVALRSGLV